MVAGMLLVAGSVATVMIVKKENAVFWEPKTSAVGKLERVNQALIAYQREYHSLPCPAPRGGAATGVSVANCAVAGSGNVLFDMGGGSYLHIGAVPYKTLGLSLADGEDSYANRLMYAVMVDFTDVYLFSTTVGDITIWQNSNSNVIATDAAYVVVSHGSDGIGAFGAKSTATTAPKACSTTAGRGQENCDDNDAIFRTADLKTTAGTQYYDDAIIWAGADARAQNTNKPCLDGITVDWTVDNGNGPRACSATWNQTPHPASQGVLDGATTSSVTNTTSGYTGSSTFTCTNGALSQNAGATCKLSTCTAPWGDTVNQGSSVTARQTATVPCGNSCASQVRNCDDGVLSGTYTYETCTVSACAGCALPWGGTIANGASVTAYQNAAPNGTACVSQSRNCAAGTLSGTYTNQTCKAGCATPCGNRTHGGTCTAYSAPTVACGSVCTSIDQVRTCNNGTLSGTYANGSCSVTACASCVRPWGGANIAHGKSVTAYSSDTVKCGSSCASIDQTRTCNDGKLSGSYTKGSCSVEKCGCNISHLSGTCDESCGPVVSVDIDVNPNIFLNVGQVYNIVMSDLDPAERTTAPYTKYPSYYRWDPFEVTCFSNNNWGPTGGGWCGVNCPSDSRLKTDIQSVGLMKGYHIYEFSYRADPAHHRYRGVMAQDVLNVPGAVTTMSNGYYAVNYDVLGIPFERVR